MPKKRIMKCVENWLKGAGGTRKSNRGDEVNQSTFYTGMELSQ
jgi:hypothetical protein